MKLAVLAFAAHPDDVEISCGGTLLKYIQAGKKVGIIDLTRGELGTRGTAETREAEASNAAKALQLSVRKNLGFKDGFITNNEERSESVV